MQSAAPRAYHGLIAGLLLIGIATRLIPHPWNVTPLTAIALFGGTYLAKRWAVALPLIAVAISDLVIGWHETVPFTWGAFALTAVIGWWIRMRPSALRIVTAATAGAVLFFLLTNFGVWLVGDGGAMYPKTLEGLISCYLAAIPFFRNALVGDLTYTAALFGGYALAQRTTPLLQKI